MKRIVLGAALAAVLALPSSLYAQARSVTVTALLTGAEETPTPVTTSGVGRAVCTVTDASITCNYSFFNAETSLTGAHIHAGARGTTGPVILNARPLAVSNDFGFTVTWTAGDLTLRPEQGIGSWQDAVQACSSGGCYFNIHTQLNPGGYIRGQLCPSSVAASVITGVAACTNPHDRNLGTFDDGQRRR